MGTIAFSNNDIDLKIKRKKYLKNFLNGIFESESFVFDRIDYIFCKDDFLLSLNQNYLKHDTFTDILTFSLSEVNFPIVGEIYISVDRVRENALLLKVSFKEELLRVIIHGILHLCKYSDHTLSQKKIMRHRENFYLSKYSFT